MFAEIKGHARNDENTFGKYYVKTDSFIQESHLCKHVIIYTCTIMLIKRKLSLKISL